ncbi:universal stress protein [Natronolimnohabitans innermongolicus]|uniref:UspA domain-containing protein n=1 Tax=Natronolimnohabitans innermongolicus JCM 12255 TaxID=1227499 RepID=L9WSA4_9EURY|nr:universal stress protein [Natronolimnohabitans innermongolicus]ELY51188.1 UspA domain-containing protein [Natronolimnohabitans innermongolicus JCM 12255]
MYRLLLPVDENAPRARAQAEAVLEIPADDGIAVDLLHVHDDLSASDAEWAAGGGFAETFAEEMEAVRGADRLPASIEAAVDVLEGSDVEFAVHETSGEPAVKILEAATEFDSNAIVLGVGRRSPVGKVLFGSVVQAVILDSDRPVTVVPVGEESE